MITHFGTTVTWRISTNLIDASFFVLWEFAFSALSSCVHITPGCTLTAQTKHCYQSPSQKCTKRTDDQATHNTIHSPLIVTPNPKTPHTRAHTSRWVSTVCSDLLVAARTASAWIVHTKRSRSPTHASRTRRPKVLILAQKWTTSKVLTHRT